VRPIDHDPHPVVRGILLFAALALGANALWLSAVANFTLGTFLVGLLAVGLGIWAFVFTDIPKLVNGAFIAVLVAVAASSSFLAWHGNSDDADYHEDAVIVLGAAVHGSTISDTFRERLDVAVAYHERNPSALIVVTGGQGPQEDLTEAQAAEAYLKSRSILADQILRDDKSTSTEENFRFAKQLLDQRLNAGYRVAFVTDDFHVFRAERTARGAGLVATHLSSHAAWYFWPANYARETVAAIWSLLPRG